jgi:hypothetical protein
MPRKKQPLLPAPVKPTPVPADVASDPERLRKHRVMELKEILKDISNELAPYVTDWILRAAEESPGLGAELWLKVNEFVVPKLARMEVGIEQMSDVEIMKELQRREEEAKKLLEAERNMRIGLGGDIEDGEIVEDAQTAN